MVSWAKMYIQESLVLNKGLHLSLGALTLMFSVGIFKSNAVQKHVSVLGQSSKKCSCSWTTLDDSVSTFLKNVHSTIFEMMMNLW